MAMSSFTDNDLDFFLEHDYNVLFEGKHGVGKTHIILNAFHRNNLRFAYFSGSTLDPWVDMVGVPRPQLDEETGLYYLDLVRPRVFVLENVQAIFLDEYNRCCSPNTRLHLADGRVVKIKDLVNEEKFYVYAFDENTQRIVVAAAHSARKTMRKQPLVRVHLDNGEYVDCTPDHPFLVKTGDYVQAQDLKPKQSLMPFYFRESDTGYEEVYQPFAGKQQPFGRWELSHRFAVRKQLVKGNVVHHKNGLKKDNRPSNLMVFESKTDHIKHHRSERTEAENSALSGLGGKTAHRKHPDLYNRTIGTKESLEKAVRSSLNTRATDPEYKVKRSAASKQYFSDPAARSHQAMNCKSGWATGQFKNIDRQAAMDKRLSRIAINFAKWIVNNGIPLTSSNYNSKQLRKEYAEQGHGRMSIVYSHNIPKLFGTGPMFRKTVMKELVMEAESVQNHKVVRVEKLNHTEDVYDITVPKYHNFALESGVFVHNSAKKVRNAVMEMIQFGTINGFHLKHLRVVWVAVNPVEEDELNYDAEELDPAQKDRFQIHINVPYKPSLSFFKENFGDSIASIAVDWWNDLPKEVKNMVSPRRLEYALDLHNNGGDINFVLPSESNPSKLLESLADGPVLERLLALAKEGDETRAKLAIMKDPNIVDCLLANFDTLPDEFASFWLPHMPQDRLSALVSQDDYALFYIATHAIQLKPLSKMVIASIRANDMSPEGWKMLFALCCPIGRAKEQPICQQLKQNPYKSYLTELLKSAGFFDAKYLPADTVPQLSFNHRTEMIDDMDSLHNFINAYLNPMDSDSINTDTTKAYAWYSELLTQLGRAERMFTVSLDVNGTVISNLITLLYKSILFDFAKMGLSFVGIYSHMPRFVTDNLSVIQTVSGGNFDSSIPAADKKLIKQRTRSATKVKGAKRGRVRR